MSAQRGFAFVTKPQASTERIQLGRGVNGTTSDNGNDVAYVSFCLRFWARVTKIGPCWSWTGARTGSGSVRHGQVMWRARYRTPQKAHRIAWELLNGPIPSDLQVNHHCDNPICCRPDHLYLGTQLQNMRDASRRQRLARRTV